MLSIIKAALKKTIIFKWYLKYRFKKTVQAVCKYEGHMFVKTNMDSSQSKQGEEARLVAIYHVIEKGLTMPNRRLGFGQDTVLVLVSKLSAFKSAWNASQSEAYQHAVAVLKEYRDLHSGHQYELREDVVAALKELLQEEDICASQQINMTPNVFWSAGMSNFAEFSASRHCCRHYSEEEVPLELIKNAIELANNAPSACNRQPCKVYCVTEQQKMEKLLAIQGGNRGFGHLANKVLVLTCDRRAFMPNEMLSVHVNGGIYLMNLCYALHYHHIAHCILTWVPTPANDVITHDLLGIDHAEAIIAVLSIGFPPKDFILASSPRKSVEDTLILVK